MISNVIESLATSGYIAQFHISDFITIIHT